MTTLTLGSQAAASGSNLFNISHNTVTFAAGTTGSIANHNLFQVTGQVLVLMIGGIVLSDLTSAGTPTISLGATGKLTIFIAATTAVNAGTPVMTAANGIWVSTTATAGALAVANAATGSGNGTYVMAAYLTYSIATATITGGSLRVDVLWIPLSTDGNVAAITVT